MEKTSEAKPNPKKIEDWTLLLYKDELKKKIY